MKMMHYFFFFLPWKKGDLIPSSSQRKTPSYLKAQSSYHFCSPLIFTFHLAALRAFDQSLWAKVKDFDASTRQKARKGMVFCRPIWVLLQNSEQIVRGAKKKIGADNGTFYNHVGPDSSVWWVIGLLSMSEGGKSMLTWGRQNGMRMLLASRLCTR